MSRRISEMSYSGQRERESQVCGNIPSRGQDEDILHTGANTSLYLAFDCRASETILVLRHRF
jgi:hypothetical protein